MATITGQHRHLQHDALREACRRRLSAELELETPDGQVVACRAHLLAVDDHSVYIERPLFGGVPLELPSGAQARVIFILERERYVFRATIEQDCQVPRQGQLGVSGYSMSLPAQVCREERRYDVRAALGNDVEITCRVRPLGEGSRPFAARLTNISAGGIALIALDVPAATLSRGRHYFVEFTLPPGEQVIVFETELWHLRVLGETGCVAGLKYLSDPRAPELRHAIREVSRFVARQLKNNRRRVLSTR